ncbi:hypothetical protein [Nocardia sp.]|uniref:hypothetical protein n=1 Tax=Nocardia sp. TaxID=1821 RepID=UPI00262F7CD4|nr:hypothetical protein [Nocardia sp.]
MYLAEAADAITDAGKPSYAAATIGAWCTAIAYYYSEAGLPNPVSSAVVTGTLEDIRGRREEGGFEPDTAVPLLAPMLARLVASIGECANGWRGHVAARRDIALLVVQYAAGLRRGELVGLSIADVSRMRDPEDRFLLVGVRANGGSPAGAEQVLVGRGIDARTCPWCALLRWLVVLAAFDRAVATVADDSVAAGQMAVQRLLRRDVSSAELHICERDWPYFRRAGAPLFRPLDRDGLPHEQALTARSVPNILKRRAAEAGFDPEVVDGLRGHSAPAGAVVQALANGANPYTVARHMRHRDVRTVMGYDRREPGSGVSTADHLGL